MSTTRRGWGKIRKLPSGRYQASYRHDGQRHNAPDTFDTAAAADQWLDTMRLRLARVDAAELIELADILAQVSARLSALSGQVAASPRRGFGTIRRLPSGRLQASYIGPDDQRHNAPSTFQTRGDADRWLAAQQTAIASGTWGAQPVAAPRRSTLPTFAEYAERWLALRQEGARGRDAGQLPARDTRPPGLPRSASGASIRSRSRP